MTQKPFALLTLALLALSGCMLPPPPQYVPPTAGPTASLTVNMNPGTGSGNVQIKLDQTYTMLNGGPGNIQKTFLVPANVDLKLSYGEFEGTATCGIQFAFTAQPQGNYEVIAGNVAPVPSADPLAALLSLGTVDAPQPGKCYVRSYYETPNAVMAPLPMHRWLF